MPLQFVQQWMTDEFGSQAAGLIQRLFEWEDAHHEIKKLRHARYPTSIPRPNLRTDVADKFPGVAFAPQVSGKAHIETGIVNKNDCSRIDAPYLAKHFMKSLAKISIFDEHIPETHYRLMRPIQKGVGSHFLHLRAPRAEKLHIWNQCSDFSHQSRAVRIAARFTSDDIDTVRIHSGIVRGKLEAWTLREQA